MKKKKASLILSSITVGLGLSPFLWECAARPLPAATLAMPVMIQPIPSPAKLTPSAHLLQASWYGSGFAGRKTTSGEVFNPRALTAASRTLPIGSVLKVTNPQNGKSVKVKINDRGPFVPGRNLDLSRRAAEKIGIIHKGVAPVQVTTLPSATK